MSNALKYFILSAFVVVFSIIAFEGIFRLVRPPVLAPESMPCIYDSDPLLGYRYRPNSMGYLERNFEISNRVEINNLGFHDIDRANAMEYSPRIIVIGDSFTAANHVPTSQIWTQIAERKLVGLGFSQIAIFNLGVDGTGTFYHIEILKRYIEILKPNMVVLAFYANDLRDLLDGTKYRECIGGYVISYQTDQQKRELKSYYESSKNFGLFQNIWEISYIFRSIYYVYWKFIGPRRLGTNYLKPYEKWEERSPDPIATLESLVSELAALSKQHEFEAVILPMPAKHDLEISNKIISSIQIPNYITLLEIDLIFRPPKSNVKDLFWRWDGHLNEMGNHVVGESFADLMAERL